MSVFIRRFLIEPTLDVLLEIEAVNVLDLEPPAPIRGVGSGVALLVGEFEKGPFNSPNEVVSPSDMLSLYGGFGFTVDGVESSYPCARARSADGALTPEYWNGNAFVQMSGKKFARLILVRADTSVGSVVFTRVASLVSSQARFAYTLAAGQTLGLSLNGAAAVTATFNGTAAARSSSGGFAGSNSGFSGGETITLGYDGQPDFTVTFLSTDQTAAQVITRINAYAGFTFATSGGGNVVTLTSRQLGTGAAVRVTAGSTGALAAIGMTAGTTNGTGNTANVAAVSFAEIKTIVEALDTNLRVDQDRTGRIRIVNKNTAANSTLAISAATATALGFTVGATASNAVGVNSVLPAGTLVRDAGSTALLITMEDAVLSKTNAGPYSVKVRYAQDDGTGAGAAAGTITVVQSSVSDDAFVVINPQIIQPALSETAINLAYQAALDSTLGLNTIAASANLIWSARQSNSVRRALKDNVINASANGLQGRSCAVRPPLGTPKAVAQSASVQPGVGATRDQRVWYCYPGANTYVPAIAKRGLAGGAGFTATGNVDVGADGFLISACSQLPPEENPGQDTPFLAAINSIEAGLLAPLSAQTIDINDYKTFKASGICALRMEDSGPVFQSGVTSVDPTVYPGLTRISRRRMADYVEDSLSSRTKGFGKRLSTQARRIALEQEIRAFMAVLLSKNQPTAQRIAGYTVSSKGNTLDTLAAGIFRVDVKMRTLASLDAIVLAVTAGENVQVEEIVGAAA